MNKIYSLFLLPEEKVNQKYQKIISDISSSYHTPIFKPHITLIKNLEAKEEDVIQFTNEFLKFIQPIRTKPIKFEYSDRKYRSLYLKIFKTKKILEAHDQANQIFKHQEEPFIPHMSLVYGKLSLEDKLDIIKKIHRSLNRDSFILDKLVIYDVTDDNSDLWGEIKQFNLN